MSSPTRLRVITWNVSTGRLVEKLEAIRALRPDIALMQEAQRPQKEIPGLGWYGRASGGKGVAVFAPHHAQLARRSNARAPWSIPAIRFPTLDLTLVAVWTRAEHRYLAGLHRALDAHRAERLPGHLIVAGDFNAHLRFGHEGSLRSFSSIAGRLEHALGLRSAYHVHTGRTYWDETEATHWFRWNAGKPFHIDYCFAPITWQVRSVMIGNYAEWGPLSDHAPVIVDYTRPIT